MARNLAVCFELTKNIMDLVTVHQLVFLDMHEHLIQHRSFVIPTLRITKALTSGRILD